MFHGEMSHVYHAFNFILEHSVHLPWSFVKVIHCVRGVQVIPWSKLYDHQISDLVHEVF